MSKPRFFLVAPDGLADDAIAAAATTAVKAGDCASILVDDKIGAATVAALQALDLAVIIRDCEPRLVHRLKADGIHVSRAAPVKSLRESFRSEMIGVYAATSRHLAMEAAESGADYVAFAQASQHSGEPLLSWWQEIFEIPAVAWDPVTPEELATLLPQKPDFIRPSDDMWLSPARAAEVVAALAARVS